VDLGGTSIKLVRCTPLGEPLAELVVATPSPALPGAVTMAMVEAIERLDPERQADRVGIGHPGPSDRGGRVARIAINLPGWREVPLAAWLEPQLGRRVTLENDANCALLGEAWRGAARGVPDVLLLTLGTGVGGGVLLDGRLFRGHRGAAAEPGLICVDPEGRPATAATGARWSSTAPSPAWPAWGAPIPPRGAAGLTGVMPPPWRYGPPTADGWASA
jgi:glucokinase